MQPDAYEMQPDAYVIKTPDAPGSFRRPDPMLIDTRLARCWLSIASA